MFHIVTERPKDVLGANTFVSIVNGVLGNLSVTRASLNYDYYFAPNS
jgi:hypothetical protein